MGKISAKGLRWRANRLGDVPKGVSGLFIIFNDAEETFRIKEHTDILMGLREEWWMKNFPYFSWFETDPPEYRLELFDSLKEKSFRELWELNSLQN